MLKKHRELIASRSVDDSAIRIRGISDNEVVMVGYILYRNNRHSHGGLLSLTDYTPLSLCCI